MKIQSWVFDLDNTLYPASCRLFDAVSRRIGLFIEEMLALGPEEARRLQKVYFKEHGTTLRGLMIHHAVDPHEYLEFVHTIDLTDLCADRELGQALENLPGRKYIFTNASVNHARWVLSRLGIHDHFETIFDIHAAGYIPKPEIDTYAAFLAKTGIDPHTALYADDMPINLKPAAQRGMTTLWVKTDLDWAQSDGEEDHIHHRTENLTQWLRSLHDN
ncbi:MAG TPA: pyrimidine 5'-nucleotidase [Dongiaceae bacterium]|jgi:putative hydrolase of the HAD superfamily|nr:pyrimidine 5'-nucleotidase [Dongiaceae bacterium]